MSALQFGLAIGIYVAAWFSGYWTGHLRGVRGVIEAEGLRVPKGAAAAAILLMILVEEIKKTKAYSGDGRVPVDPIVTSIELALTRLPQIERVEKS